ncbi:MAG: sigma-70 family RNA polymerase sigma factor [Pseudomonadota bacterium]
MTTPKQGQDELYAEAIAQHGAALARLTSAYERDADKRRDLEQDIHFALWKSFAGFDGRCSLRTWAYRVAHNVASSHAAGEKRRRRGQTGLDAADAAPSADNPESAASDAQALEKLMALIRDLAPIERQVMLLYLEDLDAAAIAEIVGLSPGAVATRIHRLKTLLADRFNAGGAP